MRIFQVIKLWLANTRGRGETHVTQPTVTQPTATQPTVNASPTVTKRSGSKPAADTAVKRKTKCVAVKADTLRCMNKARVGFQTCGIPAHRRQDPEYESSDAAYSDSDA